MKNIWEQERVSFSEQIEKYREKKDFVAVKNLLKKIYNSHKQERLEVLYRSQWAKKNRKFDINFKIGRNYLKFAYDALKELRPIILSLNSLSEEQAHVVIGLHDFANRGALAIDGMSLDYDVAKICGFRVSEETVKRIRKEKGICSKKGHGHHFSVERIRTVFNIQTNEGLTVLCSRKEKARKYKENQRARAREDLPKISKLCEEKPWVAMGISRATYFRNKKQNAPAPVVVKTFAEQIKDITAELSDNLKGLSGEAVFEMVSNLKWLDKTLAREWPCHPTSELARKQSLISEMVRLSISLVEMNTEETKNSRDKVKTFLTTALKQSPELFNVINAKGQVGEWSKTDKADIDVCTMKSTDGVWLSCREMKGKYTSHVSGVIVASSQDIETAKKDCEIWFNRLFNSLDNCQLLHVGHF